MSVWVYIFVLICKSMVIIQNNKLIIEIQTPLPAEFLADLIKSLMEVMQQQECNEMTDSKRMKEVNYFILELLKGIMN